MTRRSKPAEATARLRTDATPKTEKAKPKVPTNAQARYSCLDLLSLAQNLEEVGKTPAALEVLQADRQGISRHPLGQGPPSGSRPAKP